MDIVIDRMALGFFVLLGTTGAYLGLSFIYGLIKEMFPRLTILGFILLLASFLGFVYAIGSLFI